MIAWDELNGEPAAPLVGPFPRAPFLETWRRHRPSGDLELVGDTASIAAVVILDGVARFAGEEHLADYHSPLGPEPAALGGHLVDLGVPLVLDSLPGEVADPLEKAFRAVDVPVTRTIGEPCMVLDLVTPGEDGWEASLRSKQRHELRRKRRRFAEEHGEPALARDHAEFGRFVDMHRSAPGDKGDFMTNEMAAFFEALLGLEGARLDALRAADGSVVAAAFGFEDDDAYYLYNSSFDPAVGDVAPGILLVDALIAAESAAGRTRFDFLKGTEAYKRRLGASERPLSTLGVTP